jgi:hypothetical protein
MPTTATTTCLRFVVCKITSIRRHNEQTPGTSKGPGADYRKAGGKVKVVSLRLLLFLYQAPCQELMYLV